MCSPSKRRDMDIMKLMMSDFEVCMGDADSPSDFYVKFFGPKDSLYESGIYKVHVTLPATYPYKSPSIGFCTPIFHPNVDEASGSVCLDVINQAWSPMFDLVNIFAVFLPQLLLYPNPADPLNPAAAAAMAKNLEEYKERVKNHVKKNASVDFKLNKDEDEDEEEEDEDENMNEATGSGSGSSSASGSHGTSENAEEEEEAALSDVDDMPEDEPQAAGELEL